MKVKVIRPFKDKGTGTRYRVGTEIDITKKRLKEINGTSHGQLVEEAEEQKSVEETEELKPDK